MNIKITITPDREMQAYIRALLTERLSVKKEAEAPGEAEEPVVEEPEEPEAEEAEEPEPVVEEAAAPVEPEAEEPEAEEPEDPEPVVEEAAALSEPEAEAPKVEEPEAGGLQALRQRVNDISRRKGLNWIFQWLGEVGADSIGEIPEEKIWTATELLQKYA